MEKKSQNIFRADYNLLIAQDFMASSLSNLVNSLTEGIHKIKCGHDNKPCEIYGIRYKYCKCFLEYANFKCLCCNKDYQKKFDEKLNEQFFDTYKISNCDNNKFILLLQKGVILMNTWMIGKNSKKHHYLKKKIFKNKEIWKILLKQVTHRQKEFVKFLK